MDYKANFNGIYVMVDKNIKNELDIMNEAFDLIEGDSLDICDVDVMWHGLHFLLTGVVDFEDSENPLSGAIYGFEVLDDSSELFCSYTSYENLETLVGLLGDIDTQEVLGKFSKESFIENKITPFKLYKSEEEEFLYDELFVCLEELVDFYYRAYELGKSVACVFVN